MKPATELKAQRSWWSKTAALVALGALTIVLATACGNKGGGAAPTPPPPIPVNPGYIPSCTGCNGNMKLISSGLGMSYSYSLGAPYFELGLEFYGDAAAMTNVPNAYMVNNSYAGQVAAQGFMFVTTPQATCGMPAGAYQVRTMGVGVWGGGGQSFGGLTLQATGPTTLQMYIPSAFVQAAVPAEVSSDGRQFPYRIHGRVQVMGMTGAYSPCDFIMGE